MYLRLILISLSIIVCMGGYTRTNAQTLPAGTISLPSQAFLSLSPQFPEPFTPVTVSLEDTSLNTMNATILWFVDGVEIEVSRNERSAVVVTGAYGEKTVVSVRVLRGNIVVFTNSITLSPSMVDLIIESDTYVPSFYNGRALPSKESMVTLTALVHDGTARAPSAYTYRWSEGDVVLFGGPVQGKFQMTHKTSLFGESTIKVEVFDTKNVLVGKKSILLKAADPEVYFYEQSPLRGLSGREVGKQLLLIGDTVTVFGEPYYMNIGDTRSDASFSWKIDGKTSRSEATSPNALTLERTETGGNATIDLEIITTSRIPQFVKSAFSVLVQ